MHPLSTSTAVRSSVAIALCALCWACDDRSYQPPDLTLPDGCEVTVGPQEFASAQYLGARCGSTDSMTLLFGVYDSVRAPLRPDSDLSCGRIAVTDACSSASSAALSARVDELCAQRETTTGVATFSIQRAALQPTHPKSLASCGALCSSDADCDTTQDFSCQDGVCTAGGVVSSDSICEAFQLGSCLPLTDADNVSAWTDTAAIAACKRPCDDGCDNALCTDEGTCALETYPTPCASPSDCPEGALCEDGVCTLPATPNTSPIPLTFQGPNEGQKIAVGLVIENNGPLFGRAHPESALRPEFANDFRKMRIAASKQLVATLGDSVDAWGVWLFGGDAVRCFGGDLSQGCGVIGNAVGAQERIDQTIAEEIGWYSPVWQAVQVSTRDFLQLLQRFKPSVDHDIHMILFTDGHDDTFRIDRFTDDREALLTSRTSTIQAIVDEAAQSGVHVHVVQLDNARPPELFATQPLDLYDIAAPLVSPDGRIGPIADYDRLACATQGSYHYVRDDQELLAVFSRLGVLIGGSWTGPLDRFDAAHNNPAAMTGAAQINFSGSTQDVVLDDSITAGNPSSQSSTLPVWF